MTEKPARRVGMREVAAQAGVSSQTVSRVLNGHPHIREETRRRVLVATEALGYRMNNVARSLGTATTRTIGVLASDSSLYGPAVGIAVLESAARASGHWIATAYADGADEGSVAAALEHLRTQGVDGIIVVAPHTTTLEHLERERLDVAVAVLHGGAGAQRQADAASLVVDHLVELGHRRIGHVAGPSQWREAVARETGVLAGLTRHGLEPGLRWEGDWSAATGALAAESVAAAVRTPDGPTAIVVANDQMALGLIAGLRSAGIRVPEDVSVAGFDDNPDAAYYRPALTTVRLDIGGEARQCVADVLGLSASVSPDAPVLVIRASTATPPG